jgi:sulfite reductase alpha subunit-like flavoprotein
MISHSAAPFRAFIQHRAWQKSQGQEVGPLVYYFGSRYRSQEYLYVSRKLFATDDFQAHAL